jgi:hypothetical protein
MMLVPPSFNSEVSYNARAGIAAGGKGQARPRVAKPNVNLLRSGG